MVDRRLFAVAAVALLGFGALRLALAQPHADPAGPPPLAVRAVAVASADDAQVTSRRFAATIHYDREANLSFRVPGRLIGVAPHAGERLGAGAIVATIEPTAFAAAAAGHAAEAARTARDADRLAALVHEGATSPAAAEAARDAARASAAGLDGARYDLASTRLRVPFAALVLARSAEPGETVAPGQTVLRVADRASALIAIADVPAEIAAPLAPGARAQVWPAGAAAPVAARVLRVAGAADPRSGLVAVDVRLDTPSALASGSPAAVAFATPLRTAPASRQRIPAEALIDTGNGGLSVWLIDRGGHARRHPVRFYGFDDRDALVGGVPQGAQVITAGAGFVGEGQRVTVIGA
jgi:RND family efflux transporter MFP subunit